MLGSRAGEQPRLYLELDLDGRGIGKRLLQPLPIRGLANLEQLKSETQSLATGDESARQGLWDLSHFPVRRAPTPEQQGFRPH
jgi:hypothetical protein